MFPAVDKVAVMLLLYRYCCTRVHCFVAVASSVQMDKKKAVKILLTESYEFESHLLGYYFLIVKHVKG